MDQSGLPHRRGSINAETTARAAAAGLRPPPRPAGRELDRRIATGAIATTLGFLALALVAAITGPLSGAGFSPWLPLHLALAGGATTAISGVMPFFVGALAGAPPADPRLRIAAVALVASGALAISARGMALAPGWVPVVGGITFLAGIAATALATQRAGRQGLLARRPLVMLAYAAALANVGIGAVVGLLAVWGWTPLLEAWGTMRLAHAWANLLGFVSLVVVGTLLHFLPTVLAARIVPRRSAAVAVAGIGVGVPAVVLGSLTVIVGMGAGWAPLVTAGDLVARAGAVATLAGAAALVVEAIAVIRSRARWTTDAGWHRFSGGALVAAVAWFAVGTLLAAGPVMISGPVPGAWTTAIVIPALALGWVVQVLAGSWTHLVPAIGGGGPAGHAARRVVLARWATVRLVALNVGTVLVAVGWPAGLVPVALAGAFLAAAALGASLALAAAALRVRVRPA